MRIAGVIIELPFAPGFSRADQRDCRTRSRPQPLRILLPPFQRLAKRGKCAHERKERSSALALLGADPVFLRISARASKSNRINTPHIEHAHKHLVKCHGLPNVNLGCFRSGVPHAGVTGDGRLKSHWSPDFTAKGAEIYQASLFSSGARVMIETGIFVAATVIMLASLCLGYVWYGRS